MEFGIKHSVEYISSLWRNKIPKLIASVAEDDFLSWYYLNKSRGKYKRCSRCRLRSPSCRNAAPAEGRPDPHRRTASESPQHRFRSP